MSAPLWQKLVQIKVRLEHFDMHLMDGRREVGQAIEQLKSIWRQVEQLEDKSKKDPPS